MPAPGGAGSLASAECYADVSQVLDDCSQQWQEMCASGRHPIAFLVQALKTADLKKAYARNVRRELLKVNPNFGATCMQSIPEAHRPLAMVSHVSQGCCVIVCGPAMSRVFSGGVSVREADAALESIGAAGEAHVLMLGFDKAGLSQTHTLVTLQ